MLITKILKLLSRFVSERRKIASSSCNGNLAKNQRKVTTAIKRSRNGFDAFRKQD